MDILSYLLGKKSGGGGGSLPTYNVTINNTSDPDSYGASAFEYSIDGRTYIGINEPVIVLNNVSFILFRDHGYGGSLKDDKGNELWDAYEHTYHYIPTKDTTLELYISW